MGFSKKRLFLSLIAVLVASGYIWADSVKPKMGKWQGSPSVSFEVLKNSNISEFKISVPLMMGECDINISQIPVTKSGEIEFIHPEHFFSIKGQFKTPSSIEGTATIKICPDPEDKNNTVMLVPWEEGWQANLKSMPLN